jgi:hypothetical protein
MLLGLAGQNLGKPHAFCFSVPSSHQPSHSLLHDTAAWLYLVLAPAHSSSKTCSLIRDSIKLRGLLSIYSYCLQARQWAVVTPEKATRGDKKKCNLRFGLALRTDVCTGFQVTYSIGEERDFFRPVSMESFTSLFTICETLIWNMRLSQCTVSYAHGSHNLSLITWYIT